MLALPLPASPRSQSAYETIRAIRAVAAYADALAEGRPVNRRELAAARRVLAQSAGYAPQSAGLHPQGGARPDRP